MCLAPALDFRQQLGLLDFVDFVEDQKNGRLRLLHEIEYVPVTGIRLVTHVGDHENKIAALKRFVHLAHHLLVEPCLWTMNSGRVDEDDLGCGTPLLRRQIEKALNAVARGLRLMRDDGEFGAHQRVQ